MLSVRITGLFYYPVKSLAGISAETLIVDEAGPRYDREWMVVGADGNFITQREFPSLQLVRPSLDETSLSLSFPDGARVTIPLQSTARPLRKVKVWDRELEAFDEGPAAAAELSRYLGQSAALVRLGPAGRQEPVPGEELYPVRFADASPLLLCTEESLADLNSRVGTPMTAERFRPNVVVAGAPAFAEDGWRGFSVNKINFPSLRACTRCVITTIDPATGLKGPEPLKTLATYRRQGKRVAFGRYFLATPVVLKIGDLIFPENA